MRLVGLIALLSLSGPALGGPFTIESSGESFASLAAAVSAIGDESGTILIAPGRYSDCAVQQAGRIRYRAERPLKAVFDGGICEGKAALVLRGREARVEGLVFENMKVPEGNGAGIRIEKGDLVVSGSLFRNSEQGILGADDPASSILIDRSTFSGLGRCDRGLACAHSLYLGAYREVVVRRSRFERGLGGHYVKSRARRIEVADSSFDDTDGRATNYMIDLPEGASGRILRNVMVQGADKENRSAFIAVSAEGRTNPSSGLVVTGNHASQVREANWPTSLVADWTGSVKNVADNIGIGRIELLQAMGVEDGSLKGRVYRWFYQQAASLKHRLFD